jgi:hypothetical protein
MNEITLLKTQAKPELVKIKWNSSVYEYHLNSYQDLNKYLFIRRKAGETKGALWLKKNCQSCVKIS